MLSLSIQCFFDFSMTEVTSLLLFFKFIVKIVAQIEISRLQRTRNFWENDSNSGWYLLLLQGRVIICFIPYYSLYSADLKIKYLKIFGLVYLHLVYQTSLPSFFLVEGWIVLWLSRYDVSFCMWLGLTREHRSIDKVWQYLPWTKNQNFYTWRQNIRCTIYWKLSFFLWNCDERIFHFLSFRYYIFIVTTLGQS